MTGQVKKVKEKQTDWDEAVDVVVIGSGFAGLAAAIEAHNTGASVMVLEKMKAVGGNSVISDGGIAAPETELQKRFSIIDSRELMFEDMMRAGLHLNDPVLVRKVVDGAKEVFEWSVNYLGVPYLNRVDVFGGHSVARCYTAQNVTGATIVKRLAEKAAQLGVLMRLSTKMTKLLQSADGRVNGVVVKEGCSEKEPEKGTEKRIHAKRGVVVAAGGFGADVDFRRVQDPRLDARIDTTNKPFASAQTLKELLRIGAAPVQLSHIQLGPWASPDEKGYGDGPQFSEYVVFQYGVLIDPKTGRRFVNELADRKTLSDKILEIGNPCVGISDATAVVQAGWNFERALKKGVVKSFGTLQELSWHYKIPAKQLEKTLQAFNAGVVKRKDRLFDKPILKDAKPIEQAPFYGIRLWPKVHHTMGGVRIDGDARVIDLNGKAIAGLFAAGEVAGGVHGACRLGSCAITDCLVFGRIAGRNAAKNKI